MAAKANGQQAGPLPHGYDRLHLRNVAVVGHGGVGKTTLVEALLVASGALTRAGRVEDGTTTCDVDPEAVRHRISVSLAVAPLLAEGCKINVLDTPGDPDFFGDVDAALRVADLALFVVSAVEGVEVQTEVAWTRAAALGVPRAIVVNKLDRERASFERTVAQCKERFGAGVAPLQLPLGEGDAFDGLIELLDEVAHRYVGGVASEVELPAELATREHAVHDALIEGIVVGDDDLMERYLADETIGVDELAHALADGIGQAVVFPVLCTSATRAVGIDRLAHFLATEAPAPNVDGGPPSAWVFKTIVDPYVGHVSLFKVLGGDLTTDVVLTNRRDGEQERLHQLGVVRGKEHQLVDAVLAGDIGAALKLAHTRTGDLLVDPSRVADPDIDLGALHGANGDATGTTTGFGVEATLPVAIRARRAQDDDRLATALHRLLDEDPTLRLERDAETHQTVLFGVGETHLAISLERLTRKFGVEVDTDDVVVAYRETIAHDAEAEGRYKKQTGGHGQFGIVTVRLEPLDRGAGVEFVDAVVGGAIPRQFIPAVEKGAREALAGGGAAGHPVVDVRVTCLDGRHHPVDSSEMSFKMAGALACREALARAETVLLEPVTELVVHAPEATQGDVIGDLNARRGRIHGSSSSGEGTVEIVATAPTAEVLRYAITLRSLTAGRGTFVARHDHHEPVPAHLVDKLRGADRAHAPV